MAAEWGKPNYTLSVYDCFPCSTPIFLKENPNNLVLNQFSGVGFGQLIGTFCVATYYCSLMAITLYYLVHSFTPNLPWAECDPQWQDEAWSKDLFCLASQSEGLENVNLTQTISSAELWFR